MDQKVFIENIKLANGLELPSIGLGTFRVNIFFQINQKT